MTASSHKRQINSQLFRMCNANHNYNAHPPRIISNIYNMRKEKYLKRKDGNTITKRGTVITLKMLFTHRKMTMSTGKETKLMRTIYFRSNINNYNKYVYLFIYLFIYYLFNNDVRIWDCWHIASNDRMIKQRVRNCKGNFRPLSRYHPGIRLEGTTLVLDGGKYLASGRGYFTLGEQHDLHIECEDGWTTEPVWRLWRRGKSRVPAGNRTSVVQPLA
jgi:hypothetical protein